MRTIALVFACWACAGHRLGYTTNLRTQNIAHADEQDLQVVGNTTPSSRSLAEFVQLQPKTRAGVFEPLRLFARSLVAFHHPADAFAPPNLRPTTRHSPTPPRPVPLGNRGLSFRLPSTPTRRVDDIAMQASGDDAVGEGTPSEYFAKGGERAKEQALNNLIETLKVDVPKLLRVAPQWDVYSENLTIVDRTGAKVEGLRRNKLLNRFLRRVAQQFIVENDVEIDFDGCRDNVCFDGVENALYQGDMAARLNIRLNGAQFIVSPFIPIQVVPFEPPIDIELDAVFRLDDSNKVDTIVIDKWAVNGRKFQFWPDVSLSDRPAENLKKVLQWSLDMNKMRTVKKPTEPRTSAFLRSLNTVVINLDRRPDRMEEWRDRFKNLLPDLRFQRLRAVDGKVTSIGTDLVTESWDTTANAVFVKKRAAMSGWKDLQTGYVGRKLLLTPGERGCAASHIQAWSYYLESNEQSPLLVIEDDASPSADFAERLFRVFSKLPRDADILYLGYSQAAEWLREVSSDLVEAEYVWTTVGYIIWPHTARMLLSKLPVDQPLDNWLALMAAHGQLKAYCVRPAIIQQARPWNVDSDIKHSDEWWQGLLG